MKMTEVILDIDRAVMNKIYRPFLFKEAPRYQVFYGGSSSGKSVFLAQRAVLDVIQGGRNYLVCRNVAKTIRNSVFNEINKAIEEFKLKEFFNINKSEMTITCNNGYQILFGGLDDTEKIKSITPLKGVITDIWVEEATEASYRDIKQLNRRLRGKVEKNKRLILSFNPILQDHWIFEEYFQKWEDNKQKIEDSEKVILKTTYKDNKFLAEEDIKDLENETDSYFYNVYTLGNWGTLGSVIFRNWRTEDLSDISDKLDVYRAGLDFGYAQDPAAIIYLAYSRKKQEIYILDEAYEKELGNDVLTEIAKEKVGNKLPIVADSAEPKSIAELKKLGLNITGAKKGKDSVNFGIQWLQRQNIVIDTSCQNFINEIRKYKWKEDAGGNPLPVPVDKDNHLIDALRYALEGDMQAKEGVGFLK